MRNFFNADFLRERKKLKETFGLVICVSQDACSLKIKKQKKESVNLATKGIKLTSLWLKKVKITLISVYCEHV